MKRNMSKKDHKTVQKRENYKKETNFNIFQHYHSQNFINAGEGCSQIEKCLHYNLLFFQFLYVPIRSHI